MMLIATARAFGDDDTVRAAELNLRDEQEMQRWLAQHLGEAALLSLQQDGITVPAAALQHAKQATYAPAADQPGMAGPA